MCEPSLSISHRKPQKLQRKNTMTHAGGTVSQKPMRLHLTKELKHDRN